MQFSVFELALQGLQLQDTTNQTQLIDIAQGYDAQLVNLLLSDTTTSANLLYDLPPSQNAQLPAFGPDRQLIFSLGAEEALATVTAGGNVQFANPNHLAQLNPEDFFVLRLYQNSDAQNVLWEYRFIGLEVLYKLPHEETHVVAERESGSPSLYRLLGGLRLKYQYRLPESATPILYKWKFDQDGRYCSDYGVAPDGCTTAPANTERTGRDLEKIFWEPTNWTNSLTANASLYIKYEINGHVQEVNKDFKVESRELKPVDPPMEGSDVAMLEQMLWQLGLGPNESRRGNRSNRKTANLDTYDTGCSVSACSTTPNQSTSMEWMVWRFKYANEINGSYASNDNLSISNHIVNQAALDVLKDHWQDYYQAYTDESVATVNGSHTQYQAWVTQGVNEWDADGIYPNARHQDIMLSIGSASVSRSNFLDAWIEQESSRKHWGVNNTEYRINIGAADSRGSVGFHQVQSRYIWGAISGSSCTQFSGQNLYAPSIGPSAIVWWGVKANCGTAFQQAMDGNFDGDYDNSGTVKVRRSNHVTVALATGINYITDEYERLSKGIAGYNQGVGSLNNIAWPELLKTTNPTTGVASIRNGIHYAIEVKQKSHINRRSYLWLDRENNIDFCFWYGEDDWFGGMGWTAARSEALTQAVDEPNGRRVECP